MTHGWPARLELHYRRDAGARSVPAHVRHEGPLRVLAALWPEGPAVCRHVLVHPPGGVVGGDLLHLDVALGAGAHALLTTPGATRFYRSAGPSAAQTLDACLASGARLEWLPLETIAHAGVDGASRLRFALEPGAEMIGWDVLALGLPAAGAPFDRGRFEQRIEVAGAWLERGVIDAGDRVLLDGPGGLAGQRVLATLWFAAGAPLDAARAQTLLDAARDAAQAGALHAGATRCGARVVVLRALAARVEPAMQLLQRTWAAWRALAWRLDACAPRVWRT